jgi:hypothetical protein
MQLIENCNKNTYTKVILVYHCCTILYTSVWLFQLILILEHFEYARSHSHRAGVGDSRGASSKLYGGPQLLSCVGSNIICG